MWIDDNKTEWHNVCQLCGYLNITYLTLEGEVYKTDHCDCIDHIGDED